MAEIYVEPRTRIKFRIIGRLPAEPGWETYVGRSRRWQRDIILHFPPSREASGGKPRFRAPMIDRYTFAAPVKMSSGRVPVPPNQYAAGFAEGKMRGVGEIEGEEREY